MRGQDTQERQALIKFSELKGSTVYSSTVRAEDGREQMELATLFDFEAEVDGGQLESAILSTGGIAGIGDNHRTIEFSRLTWDAERNCYSLDMTKRQFEAMAVDSEESEPVEASSWTENDQQLAPARGTIALSEVNAASLKATAQRDSERRDGDRDVDRRDSDRSGTQIDSQRDADRRDRQRQADRREGISEDSLAEWGSISNLVIDPNEGRVQYALADVGGVVGIGASTHPVPWSAISFYWQGDGNERDLVASLPMTVRELESAPTIDSDKGHTLQQASFCDQVAKFYGTEATKSKKPTFQQE